MKNLLAGLGGAIALNLLHESLKHQTGTPRIDLLGEEAVQQSLKPFGKEIRDKNELYAATLGADIIGNTLYYSTIGAAGTKNIWKRAAIMGFTAGVGALTLPEPMGLDEKPVASTYRKQALTIGYYVFGALVTAGLLKAMKA